jgi:hypothetical protein
MQMLSSKDMNFVGYTYKNFEIVNDPELPGIGRIFFFPCLLTCSNCLLCKKVVWTRFLAQYIIHAISFYGSAAELKKKSNKPKRPTIKSLFGNFFRVLVLWRYWGRPCHYIFMLRTLTSVQSILKAMTSLKEVSQANCRHS